MNTQSSFELIRQYMANDGDPSRLTQPAQQMWARQGGDTRTFQQYDKNAPVMRRQITNAANMAGNEIKTQANSLADVARVPYRALQGDEQAIAELKARVVPDPNREYMGAISPRNVSPQGLAALEAQGISAVPKYGKYELEMQLRDRMGNPIATEQGSVAGFKSAIDPNTNRFAIEEMSLPLALQGQRVSSYFRNQIEDAARERRASGISSGSWATTKEGRRLWESPNGTLRDGVVRSPHAVEEVDGSISTNGYGPVFWRDF